MAQQMAKVAIRREDKNDWEARTPLTPEDVAALVREGVEVAVQPSRLRVYDDIEFERAGASLQEDISECPLVFGVKEIPVSHLEAGRTYVFFSHTIKGQDYNMPMLRHILDAGCGLVDYECITDDGGLRLVAFGEQAGQAGAIDTLWCLGRRLAAEGHRTPFETLKPAWKYDSLDDAKQAIRTVGEQIAERGLPERITPLVIGITGNGRVSGGAWDVVGELDPRRVEAFELPRLMRDGADSHRVHEVRLYPEHYVMRSADGGFDFDEYIAKPELYEAIIERHLPHLSVLINGIYWDERYPKLITREYLQQAWGAKQKPRLRVIGDVTCDIRGALESTVKATTPDKPAYVYDPATDREDDSAWTGPGPLVLAVDNLPCELPRDASESFSSALRGFV